MTTVLVTRISPWLCSSLPLIVFPLACTTREQPGAGPDSRKRKVKNGGSLFDAEDDGAVYEDAADRLERLAVSGECSQSKLSLMPRLFACVVSC